MKNPKIKLLLGDEAVALGAIDAGISGQRLLPLFNVPKRQKKKISDPLGLSTKKPLWKKLLVCHLQEKE